MIQALLRQWRGPERWQDRLGPFGRNRPVVALITLVAFVSTTLHSNLAWALDEPAEPAPPVLDPTELQEASRELHTLGPRDQSRQEVDSGQVAADSLSSQGLRASTNSTSVTATNASLSGPAAGIDDASVALAFLPKASAPIAAQTISLPSGAATAAGMGESFTAQLTTGIATLSIPLSLPRARGAAQPSISLVYGSSGGFGDAGVGWSLAGTLFVARQTDRGTPGYDDRDDFHPNQDRFTFGGQELVPICKVTGGVCSGALDGEEFPEWSEAYQYFRSRVEGSFLRFFWSPDHRTWRIQSKDGLHFELGVPVSDSSDTNALETNPLDPTEVFRWHLARQYDSRGEPDAIPEPLPSNVVVYRYLEDGGVRYLSDVFYTPPPSSPRTTDFSLFAHHVNVRWQERPDRVSSYKPGFLEVQRLRLERIDLTSKPFEDALTSPRELLRRYHITYEPGLHTSLLANIQLEGRCETVTTENSSGHLPETNCARLPALAFGYQRVDADPDSAALDEASLAFEPFNVSVQDLGEASPPHSLDEQQVALMDINADSLPDLVVTAPALFQGKHGLFLNGRTGDLGFGSAQRMGVSGVTDVDAAVLTLGNANVAPLDPDGDALIDLIHMPAVKKYSVFTPQADGNSFAWVGRSIGTAQDQDPKIDFTREAARIARVDVNADGLVDLVFSSSTELQTFFALGRLPGGDTRFGTGELTAAATATLSTEPARTCLPWSAQPIRFDDPEVRMGDLNGDGLPDIVRLRPGQLIYWPGRGNGYFGTGSRNDCGAGSFGQDRHVTVHNPPRFGTAINGGLELADVNGDGLADLVEFRTNAVDIYLNENGERFTERRTLSNVPFKPATSRYVQVTDLDGSGTPDLVWGRAFEYKYIDLTGGVRPYLLTRVDNGLGKMTELEYTSSTHLMLAARKAGTPWDRDLPLATPVVIRATVRDQLDKVGRAEGRYTTEYTYRNPLFDGRQREFRGFEVAENRTVGDDNSPSVTTRSTFLLGECAVAHDGFDVCSPADRWQDNWREPLKGLPVLVETVDDNGVYLNTSHSAYELRQLYTGRDGRRVSVAYSIGQQVFGYDTGPFTAANDSAEALPEVQVSVQGISQNETRSVPRRASVGTVHIRGRTTFDDFGNTLTQVAEGCVDGCDATDEVITRHSEPTVVAGDASRWLFRRSRAFVTGSRTTERRLETRFEYNSAGDVARSYATLSGTLLLDRFHAGGGAIAPPPQNASSGVSTPVETLMMEYTHDAFGNVVSQRAPLRRCRSIAFDADYSVLPVSETTFGGDLDPATGCGQHEFTTTATYDRGFSFLLTSHDVANQPTRFDYDEFGRLVAKFFSDPEVPGQLSPLPSTTYAYVLPTIPSLTPYTIVAVSEQDGTSTADGDYHDTYAYLDGLGRTIVSLSEADPLEGDAGDFVAGSVRDYDAKGAVQRSYQPFFWSGEPLDYPLEQEPSRGFTSQQNDAFGRPVAGYGLDGQIRVFKRYHALSQDTFDALDLAMGPQHGTFRSTSTDGHGRTIKSVERIHVGSPRVLEERIQLMDHLPTGELTRFTQRRSGSPDVVRWLQYDSQSRLVLNVEPNTTKDFDPDSNADPSTFKAHRYAYDDLGTLVGTSDARGCGVNYIYDTAGRMTAEDYSPCEDSQLAYSPPDLAAGIGVETRYHYDTVDSSLGEIVDAAGTTLSPDPTLYYGRAVSVSDRGARGVLTYDARGRVIGGGLQVAKPGPASDSLSDRYAPRWYVSQTALDALGRSIKASTGVTTPELLGDDGQSLVTSKYSQRGVMIEGGSSYGTLSTQTKVDADGRLLAFTLGDAAATERAFSYDTLRRLKTVQTYRAGPELWSSPAYPASTEATQQLSLEDFEISYDAVDNVTAITDFRVPEEWPDSAKPVSKAFEYDDLYRLTRSISTYPSSSDDWSSPHAAENEGRTTNPEPSPHVSFDHRVKEQRYAYDHLGNLTLATDDANGFFDRSLGQQVHGAPADGPHQIVSASNRELAPTSARQGDLDTAFDAAGNLTDLLVRRDGPCLPTSASCWQRFHYGWDELGRLDLAQRWDLEGAERLDEVEEEPPVRPANVELRNTFDSAGKRVIKTAIDPEGEQSHTVYVNGAYEIRSSWWSGGDYVLTPETVTVYLPGARVVYSDNDLPSLSSGKQHVFLQLSDYLGNSTATIDRETGELVEFSTFQAYGAIESDYRPARWGEFREPYKFSGKEEDVEVGLAYFGARFLVIGLGRWASADAVTIHQVRGDANPYAYVGGRPMVAVDPDGNLPFLAVIGIAFVVGGLISGGISTYQQLSTNGWNWSALNWGQIGTSALIGGLSSAAGAAIGVPVAGALTKTLTPLLTPALGATLAPTVAGGVGATVGGAAGGVGGGAASSLMRGERITAGGVAESAAWGAVAGLAFYGVGKGVEAVRSPKAPTPPKPPNPAAPAAAEQVAGRAYDTSDGLLPEDPWELFNKSPEDVMGPAPRAAAPAGRPPTVAVRPIQIEICGEACMANPGQGYVYRGVHAGHPALDAALQGRVVPGNPSGTVTPDAHNLGGVSADSPYTSWTHNYDVAASRAGPGGVILRLPVGAPPPGSSWSWEWSPDVYFEEEVLLHGTRDGATVILP